MATNDKEYMKEYMAKRRATKEGQQENLDTATIWKKNNPEAHRDYQREYMRKRRAEAKIKAQENPLD